MTRRAKAKNLARDRPERIAYPAAYARADQRCLRTRIADRVAARPCDRVSGRQTSQGRVALRLGAYPRRRELGCRAMESLANTTNSSRFERSSVRALGRAVSVERRRVASLVRRGPGRSFRHWRVRRILCQSDLAPGRTQCCPHSAWESHPEEENGIHELQPCR